MAPVFPAEIYSAHTERPQNIRPQCTPPIDFTKALPSNPSLAGDEHYPIARTSNRPSRTNKRARASPKPTTKIPSRPTPHHRLRAPTAFHPLSISTSTSSPPKQIRLNHNQVEKQYRNRLNGQFEGLLLVLPREETEINEEKKISKAEVLVLARKHIRELEQERLRLLGENERLGGAMDELTKEWMDAGGNALT